MSWFGLFNSKPKTTIIPRERMPRTGRGDFDLDAAIAAVLKSARHVRRSSRYQCGVKPLTWMTTTNNVMVAVQFKAQDNDYPARAHAAHGP